jgi:predicted lipoprotein with Yx(FWY)xxD motif
MTPSRLLTLLTVSAALVALVIAGCGGGGDQATAASPSTSSMSASTGSGTIAVSNTGLGKVLADSQGQTVYLFKKDTASKSMCSGACTHEWPPVAAKGKPTAGTGVTESKLGTIARSDGSQQVTYNGHPLYTFQGDSKPGDVSGQGLSDFGATWWAVSPSGNEVTSSGSSSSSSGAGW